VPPPRASWLTDVYGPRLTGSPQTRDAGDWTVRQLTAWGNGTAHLEPWDFGGRGWVSEHLAARVVSPEPVSLTAYAQPWCAGTNGPTTGDGVRLQLDSLPDFDRYTAKLRGKWVVMGQPRNPATHFQPDAKRWSQAELDFFGTPVPPRTTAAFGASSRRVCP
jgi:carboxypeptidase Q